MGGPGLISISNPRVFQVTHLTVSCSLVKRFPYSNLYWTDWNREAPKIETSTVEGANRRILVNEDIGLPNGLTFDPFSKLLCWADAGDLTPIETHTHTLGREENSDLKKIPLPTSCCNPPLKKGNLFNTYFAKNEDFQLSQAISSPAPKCMPSAISPTS